MLLPEGLSVAAPFVAVLPPVCLYKRPFHGLLVLDWITRVEL